MISSKDTPPPFQDQTLVHNGHIDDAQASTVLRSTHDLPNHHVLFAVISRIPEEATSMFIKSGMRALRQSRETHQKGRQRGHASINKTNPTS